MMFGTFLDKNGYFFDTVHFPKITQDFPFKGKAIYKIKARVAVEFDYYSLDVISMEKLLFDFAV
jgi:DNA polymerase-3 subunit alpha